MRDYRKEFRGLLMNCRSVAKENPEGNYTCYISFTKYGKNIMKQELKRFYEDLELDWEIGAITEDEYNIEKRTYVIALNSIKNGEIY